MLIRNAHVTLKKGFFLNFSICRESSNQANLSPPFSPCRGSHFKSWMDPKGRAELRHNIITHDESEHIWRWFLRFISWEFFLRSVLRVVLNPKRTRTAPADDHHVPFTLTFFHFILSSPQLTSQLNWTPWELPEEKKFHPVPCKSCVHLNLFTVHD